MYTGFGEIRLTIQLTSGALTPEEMSARIGTDFDRCHRTGDLRGATGKIWTENHWIIGERVRVSFASLFDQMQPTLDRLFRRLQKSDEGERFAQLASSGSAVLCIVIESDGYPGLGFDSEVLSRIARLNLSIDIDLYCEPHIESTNE